MNGNPWTPERVERLKVLAADGATGSKIAAEFGITRNAAIGKIHRMKLPWNGAAARVRAARTKGTKESTARRRSRKKFNFMRPSMLMSIIPTTELVEKIDMPPRPENPCALVELRADSCRWPLWDDLNTAEKPVLFCNEWAVEGYPYCYGHCLVAYQLVRVRERDAA